MDMDTEYELRVARVSAYIRDSFCYAVSGIIGHAEVDEAVARLSGMMPSTVTDIRVTQCSHNPYTYTYIIEYKVNPQFNASYITVDFTYEDEGILFT